MKFKPFKSISYEAFINSLPEMIWFKNLDLEYILVNRKLNEFMGFPSTCDIIGRNDYQLPWEIYAEAYRDGDREVIKKGKPLTFLNASRQYSGQEIVITTKKTPVYDKSQQIIGISGSVSVVATSQCIESVLALNKYDCQLTWLNQKYQPIQYVLSDDFARFDLSKREAICLFFLMRGKTAKEIAALLAISIRTVEKRMDSIRHKLNCNTKSEIIAKAINLGFLYLIPSDFLVNHISN